VVRKADNAELLLTAQAGAITVSIDKAGVLRIRPATASAGERDSAKAQMKTGAP
jgi:hypothetical protein